MSLRIFFALVVLAIAPLTATAATVTLTGSAWSVTGSGDGETWDGSTLLFTSQTPSGLNDELAGYIDWVGSAGSFGRERFVGLLSPTLQLQLQGVELVGSSLNVSLANYSGSVTGVFAGFGTAMSGTWTGLGAGTWEATRAPIPEPTTVALLGAGLVALAGLRRRSIG